MTIPAFFPLLPMSNSHCRGVQRPWVVVMKSQRGLESSCYDVKGHWWVVSRCRKGVVRESLGGRLQWPSHTFLDHARLPLTVFTTTERPPNDLWRPLNVPIRPTLFPITPNCFVQFKIVGNTSTEFTDLSGPYQTNHRPFPTSHRPYTTIPDHLDRDRSASTVALRFTKVIDQKFTTGIFRGALGASLFSELST